MHVLWTSHIKDKEEQEEFRKYVLNSSALLDRLTEIVNMKIAAAEKTRLSEKDYALATWAFKQADLNGYLRAWHEIKTLTQRKEEVNHA